MNKNSPGPWHLAEIVRHPTFVMAGLQCVCEIAHPGDFSNPSPDASANARLIAAAPDLLEALEKIASSDGSLHGTCVRDLKEIARAAINKAKGV
jgi:hypothetical protein